MILEIIRNEKMTQKTGRKVVISFPYNICSICGKMEPSKNHRCREKCTKFKKVINDQLCCQKKKNKCDCLDPSEKKEFCDKVKQHSSRSAACSSKPTTVYDHAPPPRAKRENIREIDSRIDKLKKLDSAIIKKVGFVRYFSNVLSFFLHLYTNRK